MARYLQGWSDYKQAERQFGVSDRFQEAQKVGSRCENGLQQGFYLEPKHFLPSADVRFVHHRVVWRLLCDREEDSTEGEKGAQRIVASSFTTTTDIYISRCRKRTCCILKEPSHPGHTLLLSPSPQAGASRVEFPD